MKVRIRHLFIKTNCSTYLKSANLLIKVQKIDFVSIEKRETFADIWNQLISYPIKFTTFYCSCVWHKLKFVHFRMSSLKNCFCLQNMQSNRNFAASQKILFIPLSLLFFQNDFHWFLNVQKTSEIYFHFCSYFMQAMKSYLQHKIANKFKRFCTQIFLALLSGQMVQSQKLNLIKKSWYVQSCTSWIFPGINSDQREYFEYFLCLHFPPSHLKWIIVIKGRRRKQTSRNGSPVTRINWEISSPRQKRKKLWNN